MSEDGWGPWKLAALGLALIMMTALVTGLVVANWSGPIAMSALPQVPSLVPDGLAAPGGGSAMINPGTLPSAVVEACNEYAARQAGQADRAKPVVSPDYRDAYLACLRARGDSR